MVVYTYSCQRCSYHCAPNTSPAYLQILVYCVVNRCHVFTKQSIDNAIILPRQTLQSARLLRIRINQFMINSLLFLDTTNYLLFIYFYLHLLCAFCLLVSSYICILHSLYISILFFSCTFYCSLFASTQRQVRLVVLLFGMPVGSHICRRIMHQLDVPFSPFTSPLISLLLVNSYTWIYVCMYLKLPT